jgi:glycosyltransferase involved in cell wall biosynthesis
VPWAPRPLWSLSPRWRAYGSQPRRQRRDGVVVHHPRYLQPIGQWSIPVAGAAMAVGARPVAARLARAGRVDVIHVHQMLPDGLAAVLLGRWLGRPVVCTLHGNDVTTVPFHDALSRAAARRVAAECATFVAVADFLVDSLRRIGPVNAVEVIPNGVDTERFHPIDRGVARRRLGFAEDDDVILHVGLLNARKGVDVLIRAFARIATAAPRARLALVGGSQERDDEGPALRELAARLGCLDRVRFVGRRPHDELAAWFSAASVFALASRLEGFPTVVREAVACGTPCVVTALPGIAEEIGPACGTECGLLAPPEDDRAFAAALADALARRWDRSALRRRAEAWRWSRNADAMVRVFHEVTARAGRVAA